MDLHFLPCKPTLSNLSAEPGNCILPRPLSTISSGSTETFLYSVHSPQTKYKSNSREAIVTMPPEVVRTLASSTVLVKASSLVKRDLAGIMSKVLSSGSEVARSAFASIGLMLNFLSNSQIRRQLCILKVLARQARSCELRRENDLLLKLSSCEAVAVRRGN